MKERRKRSAMGNGTGPAYGYRLSVLYRRQEIFSGQRMDWSSQHSVFPEYFRQQFYRTGQFFPSLH